MIRIAVIIPVFNGLDYTKQCLHRIYNQFKEFNKKAEFSLVVFDDGSTDGTSEWIEENYQDVILLKGDGNCWWSLSVNKCIEYILENDIAEFILWLNNDIDLANDFFENLVEIASSLEPDVIVGSKIYVKTTGQVWGMGGQFNRVTGIKYQNAYFVDDSEQWNKILDVDWLPGMGTFVHKSVYDKIGLIDAESFPQYHGDLDFTFHAKLKGYQVKVYPQLKLYNVTENTGVKKKESWSELRASMRSIKSLYNWKIDLKLYRKYTFVPISYLALLLKYSKFIAGFFKWQMFNAFGVRKVENK